MILSAFTSRFSYLIHQLRSLPIYGEMRPSAYSEGMDERMNALGLPREAYSAFLGGYEFAIDTLQHLQRNMHGIHSDDPNGYSRSVVASPTPSTSHHMIDLTCLVQETISEDRADYTSACIITEALRLYWNKVVLDTIRGYLVSCKSTPTLDGVRKAIRVNIPSPGTEKVNNGSFPSHCDLSGHRIFIDENVVKINTTMNCYKGIKIPIILEVPINGSV